MNIINAFRNELQRVPFLNDWIDAMIARTNGVFGVEHNNADGTHTDITADTVTTTGAVTVGGAGEFVGDVIALDGSGKECGIGILSTVNGSSLLPAEATRYGALLGGVAGHFIEHRSAQSPFLSGNELAIWNLGFSTTKPVVRFGSLAGTMTMIDGGSGASLAIGDSTEPIFSGTFTSVFADDAAFTNGLFERGRGTRLGEWTTPTYAAGNFSASAGTWTVDAGDVLGYQYALFGKTMTLTYYLSTTSVAGGPVYLLLTIPGGNTVGAGSTEYRNPNIVSDNGAVHTGQAIAVSGASTVRFYSDLIGTAWANSANNTLVIGQITFPIA